MAIRSELSTKPVSWLLRNFNDQKLKTEISIQRRDVWDLDRKSNLIVSLILDVPIENLLFEEVAGTDNFLVLDGKQRVLTIASYLNDGFSLSNKIKRSIVDGEDIRGKLFSELNENLQNTIMDRNFSTTIMRPLEDEERPLVFFMRNQAVPLTNMEISRSSLGEVGMEKLSRLIEHPFMSKVKITAPARRKYQDAQIFIEFVMLKTLQESTGFTALEISSFCDHLHDNPDLLDEIEIMNILDYLDEVFDKKRAYLKKAALPMVLYVANLAKEDVNELDFSMWSDTLFENLSKDEEYIKLCKSYKKTDVQGRFELIYKSATESILKKKNSKK